METFAEIELAADGIVDQEILGAFALDPALENQISAIHDGERLAHVVVGDQNGEARFAQIHHDLLNIIDRDRIDAAERFVEHEQLRLRHERARDGEPPFLAAAQGERRVFRDRARCRTGAATDRSVAAARSCSCGSVSRMARMFCSTVILRKIDSSCGR